MKHNSFIKNILIGSSGFLAGSVITAFVCFCILWYGFFAYPVPWKIVDPNHPRFDINKFHFTDYEEQDLEEALQVIFPVGSNKDDVENVLVTKLRAHKHTMNPPKSRLPAPTDKKYRYVYKHLRSTVFAYLAMMPDTEFAWKINIIYDENEKLKEINVI